jgi:hypothetical protein
MQVFKKLHLGTVSFGHDSFDEIASQLQQAFETPQGGGIFLSLHTH